MYVDVDNILATRFGNSTASLLNGTRSTTYHQIPTPGVPCCNVGDVTFYPYIKKLMCVLMILYHTGKLYMSLLVVLYLLQWVWISLGVGNVYQANDSWFNSSRGGNNKMCDSFGRGGLIEKHRV